MYYGMLAKLCDGVTTSLGDNLHGPLLLSKKKEEMYKQ